MTEDILNKLLVHATLTQDRRALDGMFLRRGMDLPIEIVEETQQSPGFHIFAKLFGIETHAGLDRKHVTHKAFVFDKFTHKSKSFITSHDFHL